MIQRSVYIYIYIYRERDRERQRERPGRESTRKRNSVAVSLRLHGKDCDT